MFIQGTVYTKSACIIIHGTWAQNESWYRPSGEFFQAVQSSAQELDIVDEVISFTWSGKLGDGAHYQAACDLAYVIMKYDFVILVAHSHGVTIGLISSHILSENISNCVNYEKIDKFYALGAPIHELTVTPNLNVIKKFYNLFSFGDLVQTINGSCERVFCKKDRLVNISVQLSGLHPSHSQLHHPAIGKDLLKIDEYFAKKQVGGFEKFCFNHPAMICFYPYKLPDYQIQEDQDQLLKSDKDFHRLINLAFLRKKN